MLSIRPARAGDGPVLQALAQAAYQKYVPRIGGPPLPMVADYAASVAAGQAWVAEVDGATVGLLVLVAGADHLLVENVAVAPAEQGHGIGGRLLAFAEERARSLGLGELRLYTNVAMTENLAYYARRGFVETHRDEYRGRHRVHLARPVAGAVRVRPGPDTGRIGTGAGLGAAPRLRDVRPDDLDAYVRMRCDPVMMAELGGPLPRDSIEAKVARDVRESAAGRAWILMIESASGAVAGSVVVWTNAAEGEPFSEVGWMVLPEFQGRGLGRAAVRATLQRARDEDRWGPVHAYPGVTNGPSNGICRSLGFRLVGQREILAMGHHPMIANHWRIDPHTDLR